MFRRQFFRKGPCCAKARGVQLVLEKLEDRFLLALYTWNGPVDGLWSQAANWKPNGVPGATDEASFDKTNSNNSVMDLMNNGGNGKVGWLALDGYTGKIHLKKDLQVDVLRMFSGTIDVDWLQKLKVVQDDKSTFLLPQSG